MVSIDELKKQVACRAVEFVTSGMIIGLGTGTTAEFAVKRIGELLKKGRLKDIMGVPSSRQTEKLAQSLAIPLTSFDKHAKLDLNIDGADEVDPDLNLIKGRGGALLREKIIAQSSRRNIIIVDQGKLSSQLGIKSSLPIEVIPQARAPEQRYIQYLGGSVRLRSAEDGTPFQTDQNNWILDADFGPIADLEGLAAKLAARAGIVEHGLFLNLAHDVLVAGENGMRHLQRTK
ncbi:MAG: ribose-5-phosphate isomerase RpiA [Desulfobacterales bacterium]|jgi:ribose 5-phosphate isomerase A